MGDLRLKQHKRTNLDSSGEKYQQLAYGSDSHKSGEIASSFSSNIVLRFRGCPLQKNRKKKKIK